MRHPWHLAGAWLPCRFPGLCWAGGQGVGSGPPDIRQVWLQDADISSPSFFLRRREVVCVPRYQWAVVPLSPPAAARRGVLCHASADQAFPVRQLGCCSSGSCMSLLSLIFCAISVLERMFPLCSLGLHLLGGLPP